MRISADGKQVWVANLEGTTVSVIDVGSRKQIDQIEVGKGPAQVAFTPDSRFGFVTLSKENAVAVVDFGRRKLIQKIAVGTVPIQLYSTPDSQFILVANQGSKEKPGKTISIVEVAKLKEVSTIKTGAGTHGIVVDQAGRLAFVTNTYANTVSVINIANRRVISTIAVGTEPNGITITP